MTRISFRHYTIPNQYLPCISEWKSPSPLIAAGFIVLLVDSQVKKPANYKQLSAILSFKCSCNITTLKWSSKWLRNGHICRNWMAPDKIIPITSISCLHELQVVCLSPHSDRHSKHFARQRFNWAMILLIMLMHILTNTNFTICFNSTVRLIGCVRYFNFVSLDVLW